MIPGCQLGLNTGHCYQALCGHCCSHTPTILVHFLDKRHWCHSVMLREEALKVQLGSGRTWVLHLPHKGILQVKNLPQCVASILKLPCSDYHVASLRCGVLLGSARAKGPHQGKARTTNKSPPSTHLCALKWDHLQGLLARWAAGVLHSG